MSPRRSAEEARGTREAIVDRAVEIASVEGLQGVTIGRLAADLEMSKAGVIGHFGTKEVLQLSAISQANGIFGREVWRPNRDVEPGLPRLRAFCESWIDYLERGVFPGGCFITAASSEFDGRPGLVRDEIRRSALLWRRTLADEARTARDAGDLPASADPELIAFQIGAIALATNEAIQLFGDDQAGAKARAAIREILDR